MVEEAPGPSKAEEKPGPPDYESLVPKDNWLCVSAKELDCLRPEIAKAVALAASTPDVLVGLEDVGKLYKKINEALLDGKVHDGDVVHIMATLAEKAEQLARRQMSVQEYSMETGDVGLVAMEELQPKINFAFRLESLSGYPWFNQLNKLEQTQVVARVRMLAAAGNKRQGGLEDVIRNEPLSMRREEFEQILRCEGVWVSLKSMFQTLFERDDSQPDYYAIKLKMNDEDRDDPSNANQILSSINEFKDNLRKRLMKEGYTELNARRAVAVAWNLLYVGDAIESADVDRKAYDYVTFSSQARTFYHPAAQARSKWGIPADPSSVDIAMVGYDEKWGGNVGDWTIMRRETDKKFKERLLVNQEIPPFTKLPFPEKTFVSLFEYITVAKRGDRQINLAEALMEGYSLGGIDFDGLDPDVFATWRDTANSVYTVYKFITNEGPGNKDFDFTSLRGALAKLTNPRQTNTFPLKEVYRDPELIAWCILGYYGLDMLASVPLVPLHSLEIGHDMSYTHMLKMNAFKQLGISKEQIKEVKRLIGASMNVPERRIKRGLKALFENF